MWNWDEMPDEIKPAEDLSADVWHTRTSFTHRVGELRVCVNAFKKNFWIYGGTFERRNYTWTSCPGGAVEAWGKVKAACAAASASGVGG